MSRRIADQPPSAAKRHQSLTMPLDNGLERLCHGERAHPGIIARRHSGVAEASPPTSRSTGRAGALASPRTANGLVPVYTTKGQKRYRYYLSKARLLGAEAAGSLSRLPAGMLEQFLTEQVAGLLTPAWRPSKHPAVRVQEALVRVKVAADQIMVELAQEAVAPGVSSALRLPFHRSGRRGAVIAAANGSAPDRTPKIDRALVRAVVLARAWAGQLEIGDIASVRDLAASQRLCHRYTSKLMPLAYLAPDLAEAILGGRQPRTLTLRALTRQPLPLDWTAQRNLVNSLL